jgi:hypothetical protein
MMNSSEFVRGYVKENPPLPRFIPGEIEKD